MARINKSKKNIKPKKYLGYNITPEMEEFYDLRVSHHKILVYRVMDYLFDRVFSNYSNDDKEKFYARAVDHDFDKFVGPLRTPYTIRYWLQKQTGKTIDIPEAVDNIREIPNVSDDLEKACCEAITKHIMDNRHHPECLGPTNMTNTDLVEMVADWWATAYERGNSVRDWADKNIGKRWKFTEKQIKFIHNLIDLMDGVVVKG